EIWQLNKGRFWPAVSGYKRFDNPHLIYPRWTLTLPDDATIPPNTVPVQPADPPPTGTSPGSTPGTPAPRAPTASPTSSANADPDGVVPAPAASPTTAPAPTSPAAAYPSPPPPPPDTPPPAVADEHGVTLPGGWIPWALACAVTSAAAVVWLQRRRRYLPRPLDGTAADHRSDPPQTPAVVRHIHHAWHTRPGHGDAATTPP